MALDGADSAADELDDTLTHTDGLDNVVTTGTVVNLGTEEGGLGVVGFGETLFVGWLVGGTRLDVFVLLISGPDGCITGDGFCGRLKLNTLFTVIGCKFACGECLCNDGLDRGIDG